MSEALAKLASLRQELTEAIDADADGYQTVVAAFKARKNAPAAQAQAAGEAVTAALRGAASVPLRVAQCAAEVAALILALRGKTSPRMASDLTVSMALARAAVEGALANVEINLDLMDVVAGAAFLAQSRSAVAALRKQLQSMA